MPKISKITKEKTEQFIELVRENVPLYDQRSRDYSNAPFNDYRFLCCLIQKKN